MDHVVSPSIAMPGSSGAVTEANGPEELGVVTYVHKYLFPIRVLTSATLAITAVMSALYFLVGFPPAFDTYYEKMYFHGIGIGLAALAVYLVIHVFKLQRFEPPIDFPMVYRAFIAVVCAAIGGLVFLNVSVSDSLPDVGVFFFLIAFILMADVGGALFIELFLLPRKQAKSYKEETANLVDYIGRVVPISKSDRGAYAHVGVAYWLTLAAIASAFVAGMLGFVNLLLRAIGPSFLAGYMSWLGLDTQGFEDATLDPHSHMMALALMGGVVGVAAVRFGILNSESRLRRNLARVGASISLIGVIGTTIVLGAVALLNFAPPTLFPSPDGVNGMAGDDAVMAVIGIGAMVILVAVLAERGIWRNPLRLTVLGTWLGAMLLNVGQGFWIEFHQDQFTASLAANDESFKIAQPMTGIFLLTALALVLLLVDVYGVQGRARRIVTWTAALGLVAAIVGTTLWTFVDPSNNGVSFGVYVAGAALSYLAILFGAFVIRSAKVPPPATAQP
jgi:hypothetical protein